MRAGSLARAPARSTRCACVAVVMLDDDTAAPAANGPATRPTAGPRSTRCRRPASPGRGPCAWPTRRGGSATRHSGSRPARPPPRREPWPLPRPPRSRPRWRPDRRAPRPTRPTGRAGRACRTAAGRPAAGWRRGPSAARRHPSTRTDGSTGASSVGEERRLVESIVQRHDRGNLRERVANATDADPDGFDPRTTRRPAHRTPGSHPRRAAPPRRPPACRWRAPRGPRRVPVGTLVAAVSSNRPASNAPSVTFRRIVASSSAGPDADAPADPPATHDRLAGRGREFTGEALRGSRIDADRARDDVDRERRRAPSPRPRRPRADRPSARR